MLIYCFNTCRASIAVVAFKASKCVLKACFDVSTRVNRGFKAYFGGRREVATRVVATWVVATRWFSLKFSISNIYLPTYLHGKI
jgi:hypothetical protein